MAIATGTAIAIGLAGASAASQVAAAKIGSNAAKRAAGTQVASGNQAMAAQDRALAGQQGVYQQVYNDQRAGMEPYAQAGRNSMGTLGALMTPGVPFSPQMQQQQAQANAARPNSWAPMDPNAPNAAMAPPPPSMPSVASQQPWFQEIAGAYRTALGRDPSEAEVLGHVGGGQAVGPQNVAQALSTIRNSPEARQFQASQIPVAQTPYVASGSSRPGTLGTLARGR